MPKFKIRELREDEEFLLLADIQLKVWGFEPEDVAAPHLIMLHQQLGGVVLGAFDSSGELIGFTYSFYGLMGKTPIHWSHMLAVLPEYRGYGIGKQLKWRQREAILRRGVGICRWTFDPLETVNARLNIYTLGCTSSEYQFNVYGRSSGPLHSGLPTDRFVARWDLDSERAKKCAAGSPEHAPVDPETLVQICEIRESDDILLPGDTDLSLDKEFLSMLVVNDIQEMKRSHPEAAMLWRRITGEVFSSYFERGYELVDVFSSDETGFPFFSYVIKRSES